MLNWYRQRKQRAQDVEAVKEARGRATRNKLEMADRAIRILDNLQVNRRLNEGNFDGPERRAAAH